MTRNSRHRVRQALIDAISERTRHLLDEAEPWFRRHRSARPQPELRFDLTGRSAGQVRFAPGRSPVIRFNLAIAAEHPEAFIDQTVPHEVAHLVTTTCFPGARPHGPEWRSVMGSFGWHDAPRCHSFTVPQAQVRSQRRWRYACGCRVHELSTTRHYRVEAGRAEYLCRHCGTPLRPLDRTAAR
jgi:SprT protein